MSESRQSHKKSRSDEVPEILKIIMLWSKWLLWDANKTGDRSSLDEYWHMREWMMLVMLEYNLEDNISPEITDKNYMKAWFELDKVLNKKELKAMTHTNYQMVYKYNGITPVDLTLEAK